MAMLVNPSEMTPQQRMDEQLAYAADDVARNHPHVVRLREKIKKKIHKAMKAAVRGVKMTPTGEEV